MEQRSRMSKTYDEIIISKEQYNDLTDEILTRSHPLGNNVYEYTSPRYDSDLYQLLFNWHPDHFVEEPGVRPAIILGRRGAGKSSYLNNLSHKESVLAIAVRSWDVVDLVEKNVKSILQTQDVIDAEKVADIWHLVFLTLATKRAGELEISEPHIKAMLQNFPIKEIATKTVSIVIGEMLDFVKNSFIKNKNTNIDLSTIVSSLGMGHNTLHEWEASLSEFAKQLDSCIIIMIDNPERLDPSPRQGIDQGIEKAYAEISTARWQTYAGLLAQLAHFNEGKVGVQARYCVPAEQYFFLQDRSSARLKDFSSVQVLHWTSGEILSALAHRYMVYLQLYPNNREQSRYDYLLKIPIYTREGAFQFFKSVFESTIVNDRGLREDSVTYLLRHTQLLPRQIIVYVNEAISLALRENDQYNLTSLESRFLKQAIQSNEELCAIEIVDSYSSIFPEGNELMNSIASLPALSTIDEIKSMWSQVGAKKTLNKYAHVYPEVQAESDRFIRFLIEVGVIGRVINDTNGQADGYVNALFEYTMPQKMYLAGSDSVAMHPIFSKNCDKKNYAKLGDNKGVYPKGTEQGDVDKAPMRLRYVR